MDSVTMNGPNGVANGTLPSVLQTDYLIVGTGPAGASLAAFMASYGKRKTRTTKEWGKEAQ